MKHRPDGLVITAYLEALALIDHIVKEISQGFTEFIYCRHDVL